MFNLLLTLFASVTLLNFYSVESYSIPIYHKSGGPAIKCNKFQSSLQNPPVPPRTNDSIALTKINDSDFYACIVVGAKRGNEFIVQYDTTWTDSWLISQDCELDICKDSNRYDHTKSTSYVPDNEKFSRPSYTGYYSKDFFSIAHSNITNQDFVEMTSIPDDDTISTSDGIIGLGLKTGKRSPLFYTLLEQGKVKKPIFSIYMNRDRSSSRGGSIFLGGYETKRVHVTNGKPDPIVTVPVATKYGFWEFEMSSIYFELNYTRTMFCNEKCNVIIKSDTMKIFVPKQQLLDIVNVTHAKPDKAIQGAYAVNCDSYTRFPSLHFNVSGTTLTLKGKHYTQVITNVDTSHCILSFRENDFDSLNDSWLLGGAFLEQYYSIYNVQDRTIGLVRAA